MNIGQHIRRYRKKANLSQKELGRLVGMTQQQIAQYETGKRKPKSETIIKLAMALGCSAADLTDEILDFNIGAKIGNKNIIENGKIPPNITNITELLELLEDAPFKILTEGEKLIACYNSLNDIGKDRVLEYIELLASTQKYTKNEE